MFQHGASRGHGQRISRKCSRLIHRTDWRDQVHDLFRPSVGADWQAPADDLAHRGQVGTYVVQLLRTAEGYPKSGHHFIEDQHRVLPLGDQAQSDQIIVCCGNASHVADDRLHDHACNLMLVLLKSVLDRRQIVKRQRERELNEFFRNAGGSRNAERRNARSGLHQQCVGMTVIAAFELDDVFAFCISARQADCGHGRFRARADEANFLHVREGGQHQFCKISFRRSRCSEAGSVARCADDGVEDIRLGMAENKRSPGSDVVDVFVFVRVPDVRTFAAHDEWRVATHGSKRAHRRIHAARDHAFGALLQASRLFRLA